MGGTYIRGGHTYKGGAHTDGYTYGRTHTGTDIHTEGDTHGGDINTRETYRQGRQRAHIRMDTRGQTYAREGHTHRGGA